MVLNLVKKREKRRKHEGYLSDFLSSSIKYLNMFLHEEEHIRYIHFDMARSNKRTTNVMAKLGDIGKQRSTDLGKQIGTTQCGNFRMFLPLKFYVKSILVIL